jgi:hypothetical protein
MRSMLAAILLAAGIAPAQAPVDPRGLATPRPQGPQYGDAQPASLAGMDLAPGSCEGSHVLVKGRLDLLEPGRYWLLKDGTARALLLPAEGLAGADLDRMVGTWVDVRGLCREIRPKEYARGVDVDLLKYPDLPVLPAPAMERPHVSITVFSLADAEGPGREGKSAATAIIRTVLNDPSGFVGVNVRIVGLFRGANLFGDLPAESRRGESDWVLKEDDRALWIVGKEPKGKGWSLDPSYRGDSVRWLAVEGKIEVVNGVAYLRASKLTLTRDPGAVEAESR